MPEGREISNQVLAEAMLKNGEHVHRLALDGNYYCQGNDSECPLWGIQLREAMEAWNDVQREA